MPCPRSGIHPRDLPEPLRSALIGPRARAAWTGCWSAGHSSILAAAQALGLWQAALYDQVAGSNAPAADRSSTVGAPQAPRS